MKIFRNLSNGHICVSMTSSDRFGAKFFTPGLLGTLLAWENNHANNEEKLVYKTPIFGNLGQDSDRLGAFKNFFKISKNPKKHFKANAKVLFRWGFFELLRSQNSPNFLKCP